MAKTENLSKNALVRIIGELLPGKHNTIPLSTPVLHVLRGNYEMAAIFSQCMYWSERTDDPDGWFYKSYEDWYEELVIKEQKCRDRIQKLEELGWIQTMIWHVNNAPTMHIRVDLESFAHDLVEAYEQLEQEKAERKAKKEADLKRRREKRAKERKASKPCVSSIRSKSPDASLENHRMHTTEITGCILSNSPDLYKQKLHSEITPETTTETTKYIESVSKENALQIGKMKLERELSHEEGGYGGSVPSTNSKEVPVALSVKNTLTEEEEAIALYSAPWNPKEEGLRINSNGHAVLPPANKHKVPRFGATRLAQYIACQHLGCDFKIYYPGEGNKCLVETREDSGHEDVVFHKANQDALRPLREANYQKGVDFNEILQKCWEVAYDFWKNNDDAMDRFKSEPLLYIFDDFLAGWYVEESEYDPEEWEDEVEC